MQTVRAAISGTGKGDHPTLKKFIAEATLYKHVGLNLDDLRDRPFQEAIDYLTIASLITQEEDRITKKQRAESQRSGR